MRLEQRIILASRAPAPQLGLRLWRAQAVRAWQAIRTRSARSDLVLELPDFMMLLALCLRNGLPLLSALEWLAPQMSGRLALEIKAMLAAIELGADLQQELAELARRLPEPALEELVDKLLMALERGAPIAEMVIEQADSVRLEIGNRLLKQAGANETKMLIPVIFLILPITVAFAVFPSLLLLQRGL